MKKIIVSLFILVNASNGFSQTNWSLSMTGYDQTYSPADLVTASNGDVYLGSAKYNNTTNAFINKLFKSTDQGASWSAVAATGLTNLGNVHTLAISGNKMILAGMDINSANGAKIFTSADNGASWTLSMTGYDQNYAPADLVTAANGDVYLSCAKYDNTISGFINKLFKSTNQGASWAAIASTGLTNLGNVSGFAISGSKMILGGVDVNSTNGPKIFTSADNGASWNLSMTGYDQTYSPADFVTAVNGDVYLGSAKYNNGINGYMNKLFKSTDQGATWNALTTTGLTNLGNVHTLAISGNKMILGGMDVNSANGAKIFTSSFPVTTVGIGQNEFSNTISVYPNPFNDRITIDLELSNQGSKIIKLTSVTGEVIKHLQTLDNSPVLLEVDDLSAGLYFISLDDGLSVKVCKLIKR